jgi:multidrug resistance efflux pump
MVSQDVSIVAPEFAGRVLSVEVQAGEMVLPGQTLTTMRSQQMLRDIAQLSTDLASAAARLSEMRIRQRKLASLIPVARARVEATERYRKDVTGLRGAGLATTSKHASVIEDAFDALENLKELEAEATLVEAEVSHVRTAAARARRALSDVESLYNDGVLVAPAQGIVGIVSIAQGEGVEEGESVMEIFHGEQYVLAYLPVGTLYQMDPEDEVVLRYGFQTVPGRIDLRLPLAYRLPQEFQRAFQTADRQQLVRIRIDGEPPPPLFTKVEVTWPWSIRAVLADAARSLDMAIRAAHGAVARESD